MKNIEIHIPKWPIGIYYFGALFLLPQRTSQFPFQTEDLWALGIIPALIGVIGILTSGMHDGRRTFWILFLAGILGVALSFIPWRHAVFR